MNFSLRKISPLFGLLVAASACSNKSKITEDVLAQDSTLALSVMSANRDSLAPSLGDDSLTLAIKSGAISAPASGGATPPTVPAQKPAITLNPEPARPVASTPATARARVSGRSASRSRAITQTAATTTSRRSTKVSRTSRPTVLARANAQVGTQSQSERRTTDRAATTTRVNALIPAGSNIELTSDDQVCSSTSAVGDTFTTRVAENVVGPYGILIDRKSTRLNSSQ